MADNKANTNYGFGDIHRYLNGQMTAKEMHDLERAALQDPFLADAIEGYHNSNKELSEKHLNEITAAIQSNHQGANIIAFSKRRRYRWLAAACIVFFLGISVFVLYQNKNNNKLATVTSNVIKSGKTKDSFYNKNNKLDPSQEDSETAVIREAIIPAKPKGEEPYTASVSRKKEQKQSTIASTSPSKKEDSMLIAAAPAALSNRSKAMSLQPSLPATTDTFHNDTMDKSIAKGYTTRAFASSPKPLWTTDKVKPFLLSEVEVININKKIKKATDTAAVKPEGGWLLFQDYLFSKLGNKDSLAVANPWNNIGDIELEFSVSPTGMPYDVEVLHGPDSTTANKAATAIEQGPKWISTDKKEKRLNLKF